ncbi:bromodomain adjacent to zinc finger domain protein 2B isoform X4 [Pristis pectinata]|uniref:bromodomain adjacent to zinc finger domain protein 2B isoform X4 n=1 Tax=Pristis pectinata TaxID=685728 RepID=UPI00223CDFF5|nr:bromodomain adjacent to zinc finger domain protein 2B isoform X4 [Pristis pectinata]
MESGERLTSTSSAPSSTSSASSTATAVSKGSISAGAGGFGSTLSTCGQMFRAAAGDQPFNLSAVSSAFPMVNHAAFGLHTTSSGRSEFGGLGTIGASSALVGHTQLSSFPGTEWWRATDSPARAGTTFFPSGMLRIPPVFAASTPNHDSNPFHSRNTNKFGRGTQKGINGSLNGSSITAVSGVSTSGLATIGMISSGQTHMTISGKGRKCILEQSRLSETPDKVKEKKPRKKAIESSSNSESESGTSSDSSSEGLSSSDSDDFDDDDDDEDDDDEDDDEDDDDHSVGEEDSEDADSDSETESPHSKKTKGLMHTMKESKEMSQTACDLKYSYDKRMNQHLHLATDSQTSHPFQSQQKQPPVLSQLSLIFQSSHTNDESGKKQQSVIQSTGLTVGMKPVPSVNQGRKESSPKPAGALPELLKAGNICVSEELGSPHDLRLKQELFKQSFPAQLKKQQEQYKAQKKAAAGGNKSFQTPLSSPKSAASSPAHQKLPPVDGNQSSPSTTSALVQQQPNGVIQSVIQEAPLALTTKSRIQIKNTDKIITNSGSSAPFTPITLGTNLKNHSGNHVTPVRHSTSPVLSQSSANDKSVSIKVTAPIQQQHQHLSAQSLADQFRGNDSDVPSSKDSDDSDEDDDDEDDDEDDSNNSQSEADSDSETETDGSDNDIKEQDEPDTENEGDEIPHKFNKATHSSHAASSHSAHSTPVGLSIMKTSKSSSSALPSGSTTQTYRGTASSSYGPPTPSGSGKRRRVTDEKELRIPLEYGWQRETRIKTVGGRLQGEVIYYAPCGKKLRQYPEVIKYLTRNGITDITRDNFSFSSKMNVGDFYEARDGPQGMQWCRLKNEEIIPKIKAMEGRRGRPPNPEKQRARDESKMKRRKGRPPNIARPDLQKNCDAKLLRKLEAQAYARKAAELKMMQKLEKQALAQRAKEARKQQAIMAAEEKRKQKEQLKMIRQQEKIRRIQQIRMEKELRAQQILEEKELRRQQAVLLKHQELERHRLDMEKERRRQHMMLMKAMEARKKAEERERLKQEKKVEKRLNKERKLEQKKLELQMAKELKKPNEDMCLSDHKPLPEFLPIPGLVLPGGAFADCLMVVQFLHNFGKVLGFDLNIDVPTLNVLQEGLLNVGESMGEIQDLLVRLLSAAIHDPGLPPGYKARTFLGDHVTNVRINKDTVSEILQIYMEAHNGQTELTESLNTKPFQAHTPVQKASVLAFLVNELACSKVVVNEIDKNIDHMSNLRRDKWIVEGKLRKLKIIHAKRTGKKESIGGVDSNGEQRLLGTPTPGRKRKRKCDSDDDDDDDDDSDDQGDDDDDEEDKDEEKKAKKIEIAEDEDDGEQLTSVEELEKQIEKLSKQQSQYRKKLFEASHSLRAMTFGQDRYKRRYWVLPQCGGVFVEGMESAEGTEEMMKEREKLKNANSLQIKEEPPETPEEKLNRSCSATNCDDLCKNDSKERSSTNLFLQKPGSFSKLSKLLEVAKMPPESDFVTQKQNVNQINATSTSSPSHCISQNSISNSQLTIPSSNSEKIDSCTNLFNPLITGTGKLYNSPLLQNDQLLKVLTEKGGQWFSLLPRMPCDESSITCTNVPPTSSQQMAQSQLNSQSSSSSLLGSGSLQNPLGLNPFALSALQAACLDNMENFSHDFPCANNEPLMKPGIPLIGLPFCGWPPGVLNPSIAFSSPGLGVGYGLTEGNANPFLLPSISTDESPAPQNEKLQNSAPCIVEVAKSVDYPSPRPIAEDMQRGWWRIIDPEELKTLFKVLHLRGIREKALQKQLQKHMDYISQACIRSKDVAIFEINKDDEENQVTDAAVHNWSIEDQAFEIDVAILQQVEELERKVASASLQIKGWICPEPASDRDDLVYYEHKPFDTEQTGQHTGEEDEENGSSIERRDGNPLDIAVTRLADLEKNIERRYLKSPLSTTIQIKLDNVGTVTVPAPAPSNTGDGDGSDEDIAPGLKMWRKALSQAHNAAQVAMCLQQLEKTIAWEKSIMKVYCQICRKGDNEELLLLCDGCDKGCHTYCHRPKITTIPDGDWFCPACIAKASGQSPRSKKFLNRPRKNFEQKKTRRLSGAGVSDEEETASTSSTPKKGSKESKKRKVEDSPSVNSPRLEGPSPTKKWKIIKDSSKDLSLCSIMLSELETHEDAWPFLLPVNSKLVPGYRKVIKKPMDFSTIREKLSNGLYPNTEVFAVDARLVFDNCETFNEDESDIGRAGHNMRKFFEKRWAELFKGS